MKKTKGKRAKQAMTFLERKEKAEKWVANFDNSQGDIIKRYRKTFFVDRLKAVKELQKLGVELTQEQIDKEKRAAENCRQNKLKKKRERKLRKLQRQYEEKYPEYQDDTFYYIAGYTSGGVPYGVTWEEMGMTPFEEE